MTNKELKALDSVLDYLAGQYEYYYCCPVCTADKGEPYIDKGEYRQKAYHQENCPMIVLEDLFEREEKND